jgi:hypothetical protein
MILTACFLLFACALGIYTYTLGYPKAKQSAPEQPEQNSAEPERPNVYYSKDIQIVSEPAYLTPPYKISDTYLMKVEKKLYSVSVYFFIEANIVSIEISDNLLLNEIRNFEQGVHNTEPLLLAQGYLISKKILK